MTRGTAVPSGRCYPLPFGGGGTDADEKCALGARANLPPRFALCGFDGRGRFDWPFGLWTSRAHGPLIGSRALGFFLGHRCRGSVRRSGRLRRLEAEAKAAIVDHQDRRYPFAVLAYQAQISRRPDRGQLGSDGTQQFVGRHRRYSNSTGLHAAATGLEAIVAPPSRHLCDSGVAKSRTAKSDVKRAPMSARPGMARV